MAIPSVLGQKQSTGTISTYDTLYGPVAASTSAVVSTVTICNTGASAATFRLALCASTTPAAKEWIQYGTTVPANDSVHLTLGLVLDATVKYLMCSSSSSSVSFTACGQVVS